MSDRTDANGAAASAPLGHSLGERLRDLRRARGLSLDQLARLSGISRATISKIELDQTSPGTTTLSKLTEALGTSFAAVMSPQSMGEVVVLRAADQPVMRDSETGFVRRCIAPILPSRGLDWVLNELPPGQSTGTFVPHRTGVEEYIFVMSGQLEAELGNHTHILRPGDALYFQAHVPHTFSARSKTACRYMLIINNPR
jgi:transcriptional regulator with XRE-family HTH domain